MKRIFITLLLLILYLSDFAQGSNTLSNSDKVFGLSKFWQEVNYNFANFDLIPTLNWDSTYKVYIQKVLETKTDFEYYQVLLRFCALLKDGHTRIYYPSNYYSKRSATMFGDYQLYIENIENRAIIVRTNASKAKEIPIGSEIIEVNGKSIEEYLNDEVVPFVSASTDFVRRDWAVRAMLWGFWGEKFDLKIINPDGEVKSLSLTIQKSSESEYIPPIEKDELLTFKWLDHKIAYLSISTFHDPKVDTLFLEKLSDLKTAKGLIIDIRNNDGGSSEISRFIAKYLIEDSIVFSGLAKTRKNIADLKAYGTMYYYNPSDTVNNTFKQMVYECTHNILWEDRGLYKLVDDIPKTIRILIPTVILMGHETGSSAEDFLLCFDKSKHVTKIGENSNGSSGVPFRFSLPGGGIGAVCTHHITYPDGRRFVVYGVKPDIEIHRSINDLINHHDRAVDEAIEFLLSNSNVKL